MKENNYLLNTEYIGANIVAFLIFFLYFIFKILNSIQMIILGFILSKILKNNYNIFLVISIIPILITYIYCYITKNFSMINFELFLIESKIELEKDISDDLN